MEPDPTSSVQIAAAEYIKRGLQVVPLTHGTKAPEIKDWISLVFKATDFREDDNIGLRSVNGLVDVDCDAPEVVQIAEAFLPKTGAVYGRKSKPLSHWLYKSSFEKIISFKDTGTSIEKATIIEIRVNHQSMAPPSVHPEGELIEWKGMFSDPTEIENEDLLRAVRLVATCAMVIRYYNPPGDRHDWGLALSGMFLQLGITEPEAELIFREAGRVIRDPEVKDRLMAVKSTYSHHDDDPIKSSGALKDMMAKGKEFVVTINRIWGASSTAFVLDLKGDKILASNQENIRRALKKLNVELSFDHFAQRAMFKHGKVTGPLEDRVRNRIWLDIDQQFHFRPAPDFFDIVIQDIAYNNPAHPVREYIRSLKWDSIPRLETWLIRAAKAADTPYVRSISAMVLIAAVRRVMHPGCKFDEMVVLESGQGQLKSTALRTLCPNEDWFSDDLPLDVDAKQIIERTTGKWIIEAAELSGMRKSQVEHLKSMLSRQIDGPVRMAYGRLPVTQPRQFLLIGTTNSEAYLEDSTGNRRFWPIRVSKFDIGVVAEERDQIWAEAAHREAAGASIRLHVDLYDHAALQQERRRYEDSWEDILRDALHLDEEVVRVAPNEIWLALGISIEKRTEFYTKRIFQIMQRFKFERMTVTDRVSGKKVKGWGKGAWGRGRVLPGIKDDEDEDSVH